MAMEIKINEEEIKRIIKFYLESRFSCKVDNVDVEAVPALGRYRAEAICCVTKIETSGKCTDDDSPPGEHQS